MFSNKRNIIPYGRQYIDKKDIESVKRSLKQKLITTGNSVKLFEKALRKKFNSKYAYTCINATAGLHLAYLAVNLKKNDIIVMPAINFIAAYRLADLMGAKIYLADVDSNSGQITPKTIEDCIKKNNLKKIKIILTMYLGGYPFNNVEFFNLKKKYKCYLIEDACHAFGSAYKHNKKSYYVGSCKHSDLCVFSFHPVKPITTGEGGAITTNNKIFAKKISLFRSHGIIRNKKYWDYDIKELGFNYRLSDLNCSLGLSQLSKLNNFNLKRKNIFEIYKNKFAKISNIVKIFEPANSSNSYHLILLSINFSKLTCTKNEIFYYLNKKNIYPQFHYKPIFSFTFYKKKEKDTFVGSLNYFNKTISLPVYFDLNVKNQNFVIKNIISFVNKNKKKIIYSK